MSREGDGTDRNGYFVRMTLRVDYEKVHAVKSILYATIEQAGMETDRLISAQELLRELLTLIALQADPLGRERQEALKVLEELQSPASSFLTFLPSVT